MRRPARGSYLRSYTSNKPRHHAVLRSALVSLALVATGTALLSLNGCWMPERRQAEALPTSVRGVMNDTRLAGQPVRLEGKVLPGSWNGSTTNSVFQLGDPDWSGGRGLYVRYAPALPDGFREEAYVLVRGVMDGDMTVTADEITMDPSPPAAAELKPGDSATVRGLRVTLTSAGATMPAGMAPGLVTASRPAGEGNRPMYTLVHVVNTTDATQPCAWDARGALLSENGGEYPIIGAAFHAERSGAPVPSEQDSAGFTDPGSALIDRSDDTPRTLGPGGEAYVLTVFAVPTKATGLRLQWNPGGAPVEFWVR